MVARRGSALVRANFHGLHAGFGFRSGLENAVVNDGRGSGRGFLVDDGAFLGARISHNIELGGNGGLRKDRRNGERAYSAR